MTMFVANEVWIVRFAADYSVPIAQLGVTITDGIVAAEKLDGVDYERVGNNKKPIYRYYREREKNQPSQPFAIAYFGIPLL